MHNDSRHFESSQLQAELRITTNRGGARVFRDLRDVREFSMATAEDVAVLTAVIMESTADSGLVERTLGVVNDLAFQLQQSVALMCEAEAA
ncbi:hypothetical protein [Paraburkholderia gardini]|uniref:hypothetical protein n=1 Tax=Paraburkholderia gardini TaxID=2823469 RepID=UPI001D5181BB|nr:hypothetical protein [Paraburkholderia gardini]CAG4891478.1 hypothetical protein R69919_01190 [Paraburkholderia gardini]